MGHCSLIPGRLTFVLGVLQEKAIPEQEDSIQRQVFTARGNQTGIEPESPDLLFKRNRLFRFIGGRIAARGMVAGRSCRHFR